MGPEAPPAAVPRPQNTETARALISMGNTSDTVNIAAEAAAEATKKMQEKHAVKVNADSCSCMNSRLVPISIKEDSVYVHTIMGFRPTLSNKGLNRADPRKFPTVKGMR
mmetsp:Transcript_56362/g.100411  ORF Transcript_56362/g.100411 Transcript_56362/m.100411 type:complete len:109 (-) Transcript_56362:1292-1618(-)